LTSDEHRKLAERPIGDARAFELVLQARQEIRRYAVERAVALVKQAIEIEGETPPLSALLTWATLLQLRLGVAQDRSILDVAEKEAKELLRRAPEAPFGHSLLGHIAYERGRMSEAVHHLKLALDLEPNDSDTLFMLTVSYIGAGQTDLGEQTALRMMACDPLSPMSWMAAGIPQWIAGRAEQAIAPLKRAVEIDPQNFIVNWTSGYTYALLGRLQDARRHGEVLQQMVPAGVYTLQLLSLVDGLAGRCDTALERIAALDVGLLDAHQTFHLAESFIVAGDHARGLELLEQSVSGFHPYTYMSEYCRFLDPVRETPRFKAVLDTARDLVERFNPGVRS
jgi:tetratricopeptide (TPR) repeat protein